MRCRTTSTFGFWFALLASLLFVGAWAAGTVPVEAGLLTPGWGQSVSTTEGVVHVWSEFPPAVVGGDVAFFYPAWGYRFHPNYTMVDCDIDPEEAIVILDGEALGEADDYDGFPSYLFIRPGMHTLEFRAEGRPSLVIRGTFLSGAFIRVDRELEFGGEPLVVELNEPVDVTGGEEPYHMPPPILPPDDGPAGPSATPPAMSGEEPRAAPAAADAGFLKLQVTPVDAAVYIDDRFFGSGDEISRLHGYIRLSAGEHTVQVTRPGFVSRTLPVNVIVGEKQSLDVWLEKAATD